MSRRVGRRSARELVEEGSDLAASCGGGWIGGGVSIAGNSGVSVVDNSGVSIAGNSGVSIAGNSGVSVVDNSGVSIAGNSGVSVVGNSGVSIVGNGSSFTDTWPRVSRLPVFLPRRRNVSVVFFAHRTPVRVRGTSPSVACVCCALAQRQGARLEIFGCTIASFLRLCSAPRALLEAF